MVLWDLNCLIFFFSVFVDRAKCTVIVRIMDFVTVLLQSPESLKVLLIFLKETTADLDG